MLPVRAEFHIVEQPIKSLNDCEYILLQSMLSLLQILFNT